MAGDLEILKTDLWIWKYWRTNHSEDPWIWKYWRTNHSDDPWIWKYYVSIQSWWWLPVYAWGRNHFGNLFLEKITWQFWKSVENKQFSQNGSPGQTTMLTRFVSKFWVGPPCQCPNISYLDPRSIWKAPTIAPQPKCRPESPDNGGGGGGVPTTLPIW